jgi:glutamate N-acetyltransferase / amino-acid N-acetyltransferase
LTLRYNGTTVLAAGSPQAEEPDLSGPACRIELELAIGRGRASYLTSDLSYDYVRINSDYRT